MYQSIKRTLFKNKFVMGAVISIVVGIIFFVGGVFIISSATTEEVNQGSQMGYRIDSKAEFELIQSLDSFDESRIFIEGDTLNIRHELQLNNIKYYLINLLAIAIVITLFTFIMLYRYVLERKESLSKQIESQQKYSKDLIEMRNHDLHLINQFLSHELKNSLAVLQGKVYLKSDDTLDFIKRMSLQIDDINALTKHEVDLTTQFTIEEVVSGLKQQVDQRTIFNYRANDKINGSPLLVERVIYNIIENAFKYGANNVEVTFEHKGCNEIIKVVNDGPKIPDAELDQIFNMNYRINELAANGSGIGLALVKNIVDIHRGSIYVESSEYETTFYLSFISVS